MTRRCANWLTTYRDFVLPITDAPESFVFWSGIFTIACALRRNVWIPKYKKGTNTPLLGLWASYPYLYLMFVGPPGFRKTTTIENGSEVLLQQVEGLRPGPTFFTKEVVIEKMANSPDNSMYLIVGEFSDIFQKAGNDRAGLYEFFTSMFDGKQSLESATRGAGTFNLSKPCLNFFSATTPGWITEHMPTGVITGGFASRVLFVYEDQPRVRKTFFDDVVGIDFKQLETDLLLDLAHIASNLHGEFEIEPTALEFIRAWTADNKNYYTKDDKLAGFMNRKFTHISKLAMIHSAATKDDLILLEEDWVFAINAVESLEPGLSKVFGSVGKNKYTMDMNNIVMYVVGSYTYTNKPVLLEEVYMQFSSAAEPRILRDLVTMAIETGSLRIDERVHEGEVKRFLYPAKV